MSSGIPFPDTVAELADGPQLLVTVAGKADAAATNAALAGKLGLHAKADTAAYADVANSANSATYADSAGAANFADTDGNGRPLTSLAPLASPAFTGTPTAPTPAASDASTKIATTAHVDARITTLINGAPAALDTLKEITDQLASDESAAGALTTAVAGKLAKSANLSDLASAATARSNLNVDAAGTAATAAAAAQAYAVQRSHHTGTDPISAVDGLQDALDAKAAINPDSGQAYAADYANESNYAYNADYAQSAYYTTLAQYDTNYRDVTTLLDGTSPINAANLTGTISTARIPALPYLPSSGGTVSGGVTLGGTLTLTGGVSGQTSLIYGATDPQNTNNQALYLATPSYSRLYFGSAARPLYSVNMSNVDQGFEGLSRISISGSGQALSAVKVGNGVCAGFGNGIVNCVTISNDGPGNAPTISSGYGFNLALTTGTSGNGHVLLLPAGTGKVGVGTATPAAMLDVAGDGKFSGTLQPGTVNTSTTPGTSHGQHCVSNVDGLPKWWKASTSQWRNYGES